MRLTIALSQVETVSLWAGLISTIVSIVLSIVAILFARDVDRRSMEINSQTIRSLEAIQSTVQRLSDDTGGLIKVAWERMLGTMGPREPTIEGNIEELLAGLLQEFRQDAGDIAPGSGVDKLAQEMDRRLRRSAGRKAVANRDAPKSLAFNTAVEAIESMSPLAIELLRALDAGPYLTRTQYQQLRKDAEVAIAIDELRDHDLLMPLQRRGPGGDETVYGLAPWFREVIGPALVFTGHETPSVPESQRLAAALREVGYVTDEMSEPVVAGPPVRAAT
ncbi:MAG: hypothetical protein QOJ23_5820 [Actinomycetota bacterium]|nr:hypothetical protein [Actinomycetota bacterium]MDQ1566004.1 hypothetical protein [Actinomycetota bacterium]